MFKKNVVEMKGRKSTDWQSKLFPAVSQQQFFVFAIITDWFQIDGLCFDTVYFEFCICIY